MTRDPTAPAAGPSVRARHAGSVSRVSLLNAALPQTQWVVDDFPRRTWPEKALDSRLRRRADHAGGLCEDQSHSSEHPGESTNIHASVHKSTGVPFGAHRPAPCAGVSPTARASRALRRRDSTKYYRAKRVRAVDAGLRSCSIDVLRGARRALVVQAPLRP